jgi:hypothetical protein
MLARCCALQLRNATARLHRVSIFRCEHHETLVDVRPVGIARPWLRTSKVGDSSGTPTCKPLTLLAVSLAHRMQKLMSVEAKRRVMASKSAFQDEKGL